MHTIYYHDGYKAYHDGLLISDNPYNINTHAANDWSLGWLTARSNK